MFTTHFWAYLPKELNDLIIVFGQIFEVDNLYHDYEDKWEWLEGVSTKFNGTINIRREHNWESGNYIKPIKISITTPQKLSQETIDSICNQLFTELNFVVFEENPNNR